MRVSEMIFREELRFALFAVGSRVVGRGVGAV